MLPLPIDSYLPEIVAQVRQRRSAVITAAPGAGKTTRVPPALCDAGRVLVLQPRRVAARSMASRVADERGWTVGREVGWHVRMDRSFTKETQVLFATEGILTSRLLADPLLSEFHTIVLDEFHERSIHADIGLALAKQAWMARTDLRLVVMSATIDAARVAAYLDNAPVIAVPGRTYPLDIRYAPAMTVAQAVGEAMASTTGSVLCFLPGAAEIARAITAIRDRVASSPHEPDVLPLHGGLPADAQDAALRATSRRRVIVATNVAETTLTVPDVAAVIDTGLHKAARYDTARAIDRLVTERVSQDSADQRAGRAGRTAAGLVWRLWDERDRLRPHREAEILGVDLAAVALDVLAWGGDPFSPGAFEWFESPPTHALDAARELLHQLGAIGAERHLTPLGDALRALPTHPRLARLLLADGASERASRAAAIISEGARGASGDGRSHPITSGQHAAVAECDVLALVEDRHWAGHVVETARALRAQAVRSSQVTSAGGTDQDFRRALFTAYPDRLARRREPTSDRFVLASGAGARLARESVVQRAEFVVAVEVRSVEGTRNVATGRPAFSGSAADEPLIMLASRVEPEWIVPTARGVEHEFDAVAGKVRATRVDRYGALVLASHAVAVDPEAAAPLYARVWRARPRAPREQEMLARLQFAAGPTGAAPFAELLAQFGSAPSADSALPHWAFTSEHGRDPLDPLGALPADVCRRLDQVAPATLRVPSGRERPLVYRDDGSVVAAVKLQELFGLADSPRIGPRQIPVTFELLAPNGRPVQVTRDLKSFWERGYQDVRKELRGRYPKHPWPDDPWTATPTARAKRREC